MASSSASSTVGAVIGPLVTRNAPFAGLVVRKSAAKTVMVQVTKRVRLPRIPGRIFNHRKNYMTHDEQEICDIGDQVMIQKCRPISKRKHWKLVEIVKKDPGAVYLREHPEYIVTRQSRKEAKLNQGRGILQGFATPPGPVVGTKLHEGNEQQ